MTSLREHGPAGEPRDGLASMHSEMHQRALQWMVAAHDDSCGFECKAPNRPIDLIASAAAMFAESEFARAGKDAWMGLRPEVAAFAWLMEQKLRENAHKGGWKNETPEGLMNRVFQEYKELDLAIIRSEGSRAIGREAADVANMVMMVADVCGGLPALTHSNTWCTSCGLGAENCDGIRCVSSGCPGTFRALARGEEKS